MKMLVMGAFFVTAKDCASLLGERSLLSLSIVSQRLVEPMWDRITAHSLRKGTSMDDSHFG